MTVDRDNILRSASPEAVRLYRSLRAVLRPIGAFREEWKKTSVHFVRGSAFVGVHFRRSHLLVTIKAASPTAHVGPGCSRATRPAQCHYVWCKTFWLRSLPEAGVTSPYRALDVSPVRV